MTTEVPDREAAGPSAVAALHELVVSTRLSTVGVTP